MLKQDYILRMIELMTRAITRLLARVKTEDPAVVHQELSDALKELTGLDFDVLDSLPLPSILEILNAHDEPDPARTLAIAECSFVRARLADGAGQEDTAHKARVLALTMYLESLALIRHEAVAQAENRAEELIKDLKTVDLPRETTLRLFRYRAIAGHFAAAEDALFDLLEITPNDAAVIDEGRAFYRRLLGLDDDELDRGHLPRSEVIESLAELEEIAGK